MKDRLKNGIALSLIPQIILVKWIGSYPEFIENYYSRGLYQWISGFFRTLFGWIPFSIGDIIYMALIFLALRYMMGRRKYIIKHPMIFFRNIAMVLSVAYFTFHLMWGFNYYREPIAAPLGLEEDRKKSSLLEVTQNLIDATNALQFRIARDSTKSIQIPYGQKEIFSKTIEGYEKLQEGYPSFAYHNPSVKTSIFSTVLTYMGYGGYLNPFTNEAQVNGRLPNFRFPVVAGHEIAHQLGYSAENETNFLGYLVTLKNDDPYFRYSALSYALGYCLSDVKRKYPKEFESLYGKVNEGVKMNYQEMTDFWEAFENPLEPVFKSVFSTFLKANNQAQGINSYSLVVSLMVAYHKEHPVGP
ncbi:MAG: DUF3810 domain-containing protein [Flavobacteriaceae bacterium]